MSDSADLEDKTVEALRRYRAALAAVEKLEREGASAHRALTRILPDLGCALLEGEAPSLKRLFAGRRPIDVISTVRAILHHSVMRGVRVVA